MAGLILFNKKNQNIINSNLADFSNMLDDFFTENWLTRRDLTCDTFKLDIEETDTMYLVNAELPGAKKEEINIDIEDEKLIISFKKEENINEEKKNFIHRERKYSSMSRSIYLQNAKLDEIKAKLEDGILKITIPKEEKIKNMKKIEIE